VASSSSWSPGSAVDVVRIEGDRDAVRATSASAVTASARRRVRTGLPSVQAAKVVAASRTRSTSSSRSGSSWSSWSSSTPGEHGSARSCRWRAAVWRVARRCSPQPRPAWSTRGSLSTAHDAGSSAHDRVARWLHGRSVQGLDDKRDGRRSVGAALHSPAEADGSPAATPRFDGSGWSDVFVGLVPSLDAVVARRTLAVQLPLTRGDLVIRDSQGRHSGQGVVAPREGDYAAVHFLDTHHLLVATLAVAQGPSLSER
jgi:hypothetical protein